MQNQSIGETSAKSEYSEDIQEKVELYNKQTFMESIPRQDVIS